MLKKQPCWLRGCGNGQDISSTVSISVICKLLTVSVLQNFCTVQQEVIAGVPQTDEKTGDPMVPVKS
jgi:hypothetical protein